MKELIIFIVAIIFGLLKIAGTTCLIVGAINFMVNGVANAPLLWTGFGMYVAGMFSIEDYSKILTVLEAVLRASLMVEDNYEQLDSMTVEMVE